MSSQSRDNKCVVYLHAGYHKTGTTFLQKQVFSQLRSVNYLGRSWKSEKLNQFFKDFAYTNDLSFDAKTEAQRFREILASHISQSQLDASKPALVSHESLMTGADWFGAEVLSRATRLKETFPNARVIIGVRSQAGFIDSNYRQYVILGGKLKFKTFLEKSLASNYGLKPRLQYDKVIQLYFDLFGKENVFIYSLEEMKNDGEKVTRDILNFMGVNEAPKLVLTNTNKGISKFSIELIRLLNKLVLGDFNEEYFKWVSQEVSTVNKLRWRFIRLLKRFEKNSKPGKFVTEEIKNQIQSEFEVSNKNLSLLLKKDVQKLGY